MSPDLFEGDEVAEAPGCDAPRSVPVHLTSFIGREAELAGVGALVREHRLVTLTGAGGSGKTRLAARVADAAGDAHPDGTYWVDLAPLADASLVPAAVAAVLGMSEPPAPITHAIVRHLAGRAALVVLDNCEHLVDACAALAGRILQACPAVTVLATSRELLGVDGEVRAPVPPLGLPSDRAADCESVRLFVDRARAAQPTFTLTAANTPTVAEICRRLDGIPLAIELAAARVRVLDLQQIARGLEDRFHLLTGSTRGALPRQRTLEGSVDWSHDLLDQRSRVAFRRLGVFAGSFTLDAAEAVCIGGDIAARDVLDLLGALVDRSLVHVVGAAGPRARYRLLETIRDYARHKLADAAEAEETRERHLAWVLDFASRAAGGLEGDDPLTWLDLVDAELDNLRTGLDWSVRSRDADAGARIVSRLLVYWFARGELAIGRERLASVLARATDTTARAGVLTVLCHVAYRVGDMAEAIRRGDDAVATATSAADPRALGRALHFRAWVRFWGVEDRAGSWADFEAADGFLRDAGDDLLVGLNLALQGWSYIDTSRAPLARALIADGLERTAKGGPARGPALFAMGWLEMLEGRQQPAVSHFEAALTVARAVGDRYIEVFAVSMLAIRAVEERRLDDARALCEVGLELALEHRIRSCEASMRYALATLHLAEGDVEAADTEMEVAFESSPMPWSRAILRGNQALVALALSRHDEARRRAEEALEQGCAHDSVLATAIALAALATLARRDGDLARAENLLHEAIDVSHAAGFARLTAALVGVLAGVAVDGGRLDDAARLFAAASADPSARSFTMLHPQLEADLAQLQDALGDSFGTTSAEGTAMSLDDAVSYARRGRGRRKRPATGWDSLTPTERDVVDLVAEGLTNRQIGQRLFISPRTVQTHLAHVFGKLAVATRAELAAAAASRRTIDRR